MEITESQLSNIRIPGVTTKVFKDECAFTYETQVCFFSFININ